MKHYALEEWVDFSRGLVGAGLGLADAGLPPKTGSNATGSEDTGSEDTGSEMRGHLAAGCARCQQEADFCFELTSVCRRLEVQAIPQSVVRMAKAIFPVRTASRPKRGTRLPIELIYDSFLAPAPAGLRATWQVGWQGLYRAGDCSVDVRIEPELKSTRAAVIGQIANHALPDEEMANIAICLRAGKTVVAETRSNRFGEFQMEYEQQSQLKLCIALHDGLTIQVPIKRLTNEKPRSTGDKPRSIKPKPANEEPLPISEKSSGRTSSRKVLEIDKQHAKDKRWADRGTGIC